MRYREATQEEVRQAGKQAQALEDYTEVFTYAEAVFGPNVCRIRFEIDHNFDDGEETRYIDTESETNVQAWDAQGKRLPMLEEAPWENTPELNHYEPWAMEFFKYEQPVVITLYVKESKTA